MEDVGINTRTARGNLKKAPIEIVLQWINKAWSNVAEDLIVRAFVKCGIANAIDGSEERELLENLGDRSEDISDESDAEYEAEQQPPLRWDTDEEEPVGWMAHMYSDPEEEGR